MNQITVVVLMATSSTSTVATKATKKRKNNDDDEDNPSSENSTAPKKEKDRIKTLDQFQIELNLMMKKKKEHEEAVEKSKELMHEWHLLRSRVVPFMTDNLKQNRVNCKDFNMYVSTSTVHRFRKVQICDIYEIIKQTLGTENCALIQRKAKELREQKVPMRQIRIAEISNKREKKKMEKEEATKQAVLSGNPLPAKKKRVVAKN